MLSTRTKIALAAAVQRPIIAARKFAGYGSECEVTRSGLRWTLDLDEGIEFSVWLLGAFERTTVRAYSRLVRPGMIVLDIGANIGAHTLPLARLVGDTGKIIAVEPTAWAIGRLRANIALNPSLAKHVVTRQVMLVERSDVEVPNEVFASWPLLAGKVHPILRALPKSTAGAKALTLDALLAGENISSVDFIKLDVDGHECFVLKGGLERIKRDRPKMILELSPYILEETGGSIDELLDILRTSGYGLHSLNMKRLPLDAFALRRIISKKGSINALAIMD